LPPPRMAGIAASASKSIASSLQLPINPQF
jgi:hypothetical protein